MSNSVMNYCLEITEIIPNNKTKQLSVGDFIVTINGQPAVKFYDSGDYAEGAYKYHCVARKNSENFIIESRVPIAVDFRPTKDALMHRIYENYDYDLIYQLWEMGDWKMLKRAVNDYNTTLSFFTKIRLRIEHGLNLKYSNALLYKGVLDYHNGAVERAKKRIAAFVEKSHDMNGTKSASLAFYYMGLLSEDRMVQQDFFERSAYFGLRKESTGKLASLLSEQIDLTPFQSKKVSETGYVFPSHLDFKSLSDDDGVMNLGELIHTGDKAFTPICLMPSFRTNKYYDQFVLLHNEMLSAFFDYFNPMIVMIGDIADSQDHIIKGTYWTEEEAGLIEKNQLILLKDYETEVAHVFGASFSPNVYMVDQNGVIVQHGLTKPIDYWRLFEKQMNEQMN